MVRHIHQPTNAQFASCNASVGKSIMHEETTTKATFFKQFKNKLINLHRNESGAVGLLVLVATIIVMMMGLVMFDAQHIARDNLQVQAAADTAAWSQSAVEARSMNMIAFANVGKRVTFGMTSFYQAIWISYGLILAATIALAIVCWIANVPLFGAISTVCNEITQFAVKVGLWMLEEIGDLAKFEADLSGGFYKDDMKAFHAYQGHMAKITPWWGWAESLTRGIRNGATATGSYPVPVRMFNIPALQIAGVGIDQSNKVDKLPVKTTTKTVGAYADMCRRIYYDPAGLAVPDVIYHDADYVIKSCVVGRNCSDRHRLVAVVLIALITPALTPLGCALQAAFFGNEGTPYQLDASTGVNWTYATSNMSIAYRQGQNRQTVQRDKFNIMGVKNDGGLSDVIYTPSGVWAMARSEISYQDGEPDAWHSSWTARMRPVALPGEWSGQGSDVTITKAWSDVLPYMTLGSLLSELTGGQGNIDLGSMMKDILRMTLSANAMKDAHMDGFHK